MLVDKGLGEEGLRPWGEDVGPLGRAANLALAYTRLLTRPGPDYVPPIASEYLCSPIDRTQPLSWGPAAVAVEAAYREAGLVVGGGNVWRVVRREALRGLAIDVFADRWSLPRCQSGR